jgi:hypothetical protein
MHKPPVSPLLLLAALALVACDPRPASTTATTVDSGRVDAVVIRPGISDPSLPAADSVLTPTAATAAPSPDTAATRTNRAMTPAQESNTMPLAGQTNDHSAPLAPAKPASAP